MKVSRLFAGLVAVAGLAVSGSAASAQEQVMPPEQEVIEVTDELLERFVAVYPSVVQVATSAQEQLATVENADEAQAIQANAQEQVAVLLEEGELTPAEYEAVVARLNDDPELMAEFEAMLEEQEGGPGQGGPGR